ncbi:acetyl-CoA carboxylase biotin carboxyl carrier protein subunit [bacterium]|nr:acetyl-CoA carboxylase biotin carboxyl carrier protein subunit [bacterium]
MRTVYKISGRKQEFSEAGEALGGSWRFDSRPGGWILATRDNGKGGEERIRFRYSRRRGQFHSKFSYPGVVDFFGERLQVSSGSHASSSGSDYTAQFPGRVRKISVSEGTLVKAGTPLLMVEAMKMEFAIKAGGDGKVVKILVQEGMQLSPGQQLLVFEETS